jgi:pyruvyltransferase
MVRNPWERYGQLLHIKGDRNLNDWRSNTEWESSDYGIPGKARRLMLRSGLSNRRNLFWYRRTPRNFGDWIGPYLFKSLTGRAPVFSDKPDTRRSSCLFTAGSILIFVTEPDWAVIWGSGIITANIQLQQPKAVLAVRGPRTRDRLHELGYQTSEVFGDPAILMPLVFCPTEPKRYRVGLIPHYVDHKAISEAYENVEGVKIIDVTADVENVVREIVSCEVTLSSSLHGCIVSHAYGIPSCRVVSWRPLYGDGIKFPDYFESGGIFEAQNTELPQGLAAAQLERMARDAPVPDLAPLIEPLRDACPFWPSWKLR